MTVVVPRRWRESKCRTQIRAPKGASSFVVSHALHPLISSVVGKGFSHYSLFFKFLFFQNADIFISTEHPVHRGSPFTQQSLGCGQRGDFIQIPSNFLNDLNATRVRWGDPAKVFVQEWAKFRYGIFDEFGFAQDPLYPSFFKVQDQIFPTGKQTIQKRNNFRGLLNMLCLFLRHKQQSRSWFLA